MEDWFHGFFQMNLRNFKFKCRIKEIKRIKDRRRQKEKPEEKAERVIWTHFTHILLFSPDQHQPFFHKLSLLGRVPSCLKKSVSVCNNNFCFASLLTKFRQRNLININQHFR